MESGSVGGVTALVAVLGGVLAGAVLVWLLLRGRAAEAAAAAIEQGRAEVRIELAAATERVRALEQGRAQAITQFDALRRQAGEWRDALDAVRDERAQLAERASRVAGLEQQLAATGAQLAEARNRLAELDTRFDAERRAADDKLAMLIAARESLTDQFKSLANDILEEKAKRFTEQNQTNLGQLLDPLRVKLHEFQGKVEQVYVQEGKDRSALAEQVRQLMELNQSLSQDAKNLTRALKGSSKTQGNWGELILERVLEASGLRKGEEYDVQESHTRDDGSRGQPDVVIHLPEDRHLVVDAKVSLTAYEDYASAEDEGERNAAAKRHLDSVRGHIKGLSERNYQDLYGLKSLDFVLMFVPVEPAFMLAVTHDRELFMDAWQKNVLLVSPSTLLFVVRTVAHLWRQEAQSRNAQDIAKRGAELYDKLVGFVEDLDSVGSRLEQAQKAYHAAHNKLASGRGNVIRQAEMLKQLGVKPAKVLPEALVEAAEEGGDDS
ncbi:DNA recombination protein RmuC [Aromatoleum toluclasticum]|uniref:DNA recombination protein RmuC n=1 Tax=Aromatoleum toluclasticum TaxID=92003 RepID=UPI001D193546|nr:DNA recombination protein RmuC [Aromatoleum toluclasticum]MCC4114141.1 DNA recombination protein RmuC [Aromatoleum toluclasticum]